MKDEYSEVNLSPDIYNRINTPTDSFEETVRLLEAIEHIRTTPLLSQAIERSKSR